MVGDISAVISAGLDDVASLPNQLCSLTPSSKSCVTSLGSSMESVDWLRFLSSRIQSAALDPKIFDASAMLNTVCNTLNSDSGLDISKILEAIPALMDTYVNLDLKIFETSMPQVDAFIQSCGDDIGALSTELLSALGSGSLVTSSMGVVCGRMQNNKCLSRR